LIKKYREWLCESKKSKKGKAIPSAPTIISAPLRGQNQDQSGFGISHNTADYTISD
jgi:hypothetical protein